jgi:hypothetical protein
MKQITLIEALATNAIPIDVRKTIHPSFVVTLPDAIGLVG